ncbi:MAG: hypothetical protein Kow0025_16740 [Thermodesulfovibrionales bacterium]
MIGRWLIVGLLSAVVALTAWDFVTKAVLYSPLEEIESTEAAPPERPAPPEGFKPAWGEEILNRNLFSEQRVPPRPEHEAKPAEAKQAPQAPKPSLVLSGIIANQTGDRVALIGLAGGDAVPLREGDVFEGVRVVSVGEREVKLMWNEEAYELGLSRIKALKR